ncbi:BrnT family toxin [Astrobacterium formosum]|uniref:BrnT family toxin n=1 Tax=Astrobacterium formosum TaxID=3069710 RepID=UPI003F50A4B6
MTEEHIARLFAGVRTFGWHEDKRRRNRLVHGIDFEDARAILDGDTHIIRSDRHDEERYQIFGYVDDREIAVACTLRGNQCWLISARRARRDERRKYYAGLTRRPAARDD